MLVRRSGATSMRYCTAFTRKMRRCRPFTCTSRISSTRKVPFCAQQSSRITKARRADSRPWYLMFRSVVLFPVPRFPMSSTVASSAMVLKSKARMFSFCIVGGCVFILVTLKFFLYGGAVHRPRHTARCAAPSRLPAAALGAVGELRGHVQHRGCVARRAHDGGHARRRAHAAGRGLPPPRREGGHRVH